MRLTAAYLQVPPPQKAPMEYPGQLKQIERQHNHFYNPSIQQYPGPQSYMPPPGHPGHMYNNANMNHVSSSSLRRAWPAWGTRMTSTSTDQWPHFFGAGL